MVNTRRAFYPEVGGGSGTQDTESTQGPPPPPPVFPAPFPTPPPTPGMAPALAPLMIGAEQLQQLLGGLPRGDEFSKATKNFSLYGGTRFDGLGGALKALAWVKGCEEAFARMPLSSVQKRDLASQNLDGPALHWWRAIREGLDLGLFGWEDFLLRFHAKFVPHSERNQLSEAFINLRQGAMSATTLINKFNELSRFSLFMVDTEEKKVERRLHCLTPSLSLQCQYALGQSFDATCDIILRTERKNLEVLAE